MAPSRPKKILCTLALLLICAPIMGRSDDGFNDSSGKVHRDAAREVAIEREADQSDAAKLENPEISEQERAAVEERRGRRGERIDQMDSDPRLQGSSPLKTQTSLFALGRGETGKAIVRAGEALTAAKTPAEKIAALEARASGYAAAKNPRKALDDVELGLKLDPSNQKLGKMRALLVGRAPTAAPIVTPITPAPAVQARGRITNPAQWERVHAGTVLSEAISRSRKAFAAKDFGTALAAAEEALSLSRDDPMALAQRARVRMSMGQWNKATEDLSKAVALGMVWGALNKMLAQSYRQAGLYRESLRQAEEAVRLEPGDPEAYAARAAAKMKLGRPPEELKGDIDKLMSLGGGSFDDVIGAATQYGSSAASPPRVTHLAEPRPEPSPSAPQPARRRPQAWALIAALAALLGAAWSWYGRGRKPMIFAQMPTLIEKPEIVGDGYELGEVLGEGGMGVVRRARDGNLKRPVAVKMIRLDHRGDPAIKERFTSEALILAKLKHPNLPAIHDAFQENDCLYLIMELLDGPTLYALVEEKGPLAAAQSLEIIAQAAAAVDYAHEKGVVHRDLKTNNMILEGTRLVLLDFGIAKLMESPATALGTQWIGTPAFAPPEAAQGIVTREFDLYCLAVVLYHLLTGELPFGFQGDQDAKLAGRFRLLSELREGASAAIDAFFKKGLDPDRHRRFRSGAELVEAFRVAIV